MGKRHPPSTLCTRQLPRTRKIGCLSRPAMRPQQPTSCTPSFSQFRVIVTLIPVMLSDGSCMCAWSGTFQLQGPLSWKHALPRQGGCATRIRLGLCVQRDVRWPNLQRAKLSPLSSAFFVLGESADLDSEWTCKCTGSWTRARCYR